ncbi:unnamed protein product [Rotaria sp. Silwood1]|nr:unnamed protein product [Rotaria sp. Silwood1]
MTQKFQTRFADSYPHLPILLFTQNLSLTGNTSKLILLANGFFNSRDWEGIGAPHKTSTQKMTELYCPFFSNRCDITIDFNRLSEADAVVYHMYNDIDKTLVTGKRHPKQRFVFALWESPANSRNLGSYGRFFNWTMTYRSDSHILTSYYSQTAYFHKSNPYYQLLITKEKLGTAAALISNCGGSSQRLQFIDKLKRYIDVKVYGTCGEGCPSNMNCRQFIAENYFFILSFENSLCLEYTTEKFFDSLQYPVVPVVRGQTNYSYFIPSSGYIDTNEFSNMSSLARYLNETRYNKKKYLSYFSWKKDYVWGLHKFMSPFCDLCLRLHRDSKPNIIDDIHDWWFNGTCEQQVRIPA